MRMKTVLSFGLLLLWLNAPISGAQLVALNMKAKGKAKPELAQALTPILHNELSRRQGISIISQDDVKALLEHEAQKQSLGCDETSCMTEIAGSLGAELLASSFLSRVGRKWIVSITLIRVDRASALRRAQGDATGGEESAADAVANAVHNLFREGVPDEISGPASMSRRGFRAALLGLTKVFAVSDIDPKEHRKRVILDLVHTELDYDATPKIDELDLMGRRQIGSLETQMLVSADAADLDRLLRARSYWIAMRQDLARVKEIRTRARERGVEPSGRPLRFEVPEPVEWPAIEAIDEYRKQSRSARKVVKQALAAYQKKEEKTFLMYWGKEHQSAGERAFRNGIKQDERYTYSYALVAPYSLSPELLEYAITSQDKGEMLVYRVQSKAGKAYDDERTYLIREEGEWKIRSW